MCGLVPKALEGKFALFCFWVSGWLGGWGPTPPLPHLPPRGVRPFWDPDFSKNLVGGSLKSCPSLWLRNTLSRTRTAMTRDALEGEGGYAPSPLQGALSMPSHSLPDGKCQALRHLCPTVTAPNRFGNLLQPPA